MSLNGYAYTVTLAAGCLVSVLLASSPAEGGVLYGIERTNRKLVTISTTTGAVTSAVNLDFSPGGALAIDGSNTFYGIDITTQSLVTINPVTGVSTIVGSTGSLGGANIGGFTSAGGTGLFGVDTGANALVRVSTSTGIVTQVGAGTSKPGMQGIAGSSGALFAVDSIRNEFIALNPNNGSVISSQSLPPSSLQALTVGDGIFYSIDTITDTLVTISGNSLNTIGPLGSGFGTVHSLAFGDPIPESSTLILAVTALFNLSWRRVRATID